MSPSPLLKTSVVILIACFVSPLYVENSCNCKSGSFSATTGAAVGVSAGAVVAGSAVFCTEGTVYCATFSPAGAAVLVPAVDAIAKNKTKTITAATMTETAKLEFFAKMFFCAVVSFSLLVLRFLLFAISFQAQPSAAQITMMAQPAPIFLEKSFWLGHLCVSTRTATP